MPAPGDLIHQQSTSTGTGNITLSTVNGKRSFNDEFGTGGTNKFDYFISNQAAAEWERGTGHLSASTTLVRDTVLASSNANAAVSFSAGTKDIANDVPAALQVRGPGSATVGNIPLWDSSSGNLLKDAGYAPREVLTANRTYYVLTTGSDSNNGLANTSGGAFLTIQKAIDTACALDLSVYSVTINVADGTYSGGIVLKPYLGTGPITIVGNTSTPANCLLSGTGIRISADSTFATYEMRGFETRTSTSGNSIALSGIGILKLNNWRFGTCAGSHMRVDNGARLTGISGSFTISGSASYFAIGGYSATIDFNSATITLDASVTFTATAYAQYMALVNFQQATFTLGAFSVTGQRYNALGNSLISSGGAGANFIPGSTAGATSSGGTYL